MNAIVSWAKINILDTHFDFTSTSYLVFLRRWRSLSSLCDERRFVAFGAFILLYATVSFSRTLT